jgi:hypothetical protein
MKIFVQHSSSSCSYERWLNGGLRYIYSKIYCVAWRQWNIFEIYPSGTEFRDVKISVRQVSQIINAHNSRKSPTLVSRYVNSLMLERLCPKFYAILCGRIYVFYLYSLLLIYLLLLFIVVCFFSSYIFIRILRHKLTTATESLQNNTNGRKIQAEGHKNSHDLWW